MSRVATPLLFAGFLLCLLQVWWPTYYITGDGPCHLYNAQVLHDFWAGKNVQFFSPFFAVGYNPNPNWLTTVLQAWLLFLVDGVIAEKIYLSLYLALYASGFYMLMRKVCPEKSAWPLVLFVFVFTTAFTKGFFNFSLSIAFFFWVVWSWLRLLEKTNVARAAAFFVLSVLLFFTHFLPFVFACFTCGALTLSFGFSDRERDKKPYFVFRYTGLLLLLLSPLLILMIWFSGNTGGIHLKLHHHFYRLVELFEFRYIVNETHYEEIPAFVVFLSLLSLFCFSFFIFKERFKIHKYDGFILSFLFILFVYLFFPENVPGFLDMTMRVQLFVLILMSLIIAYRYPPSILKEWGGVLIFLCFICLSCIRISNRIIASRGVEECMSAERFIKPGSVVLPLNFSPAGLDGKGNIISDRNWLFCHVFDYLAVRKPLILLDNYEANMGYFPLLWAEKTNPYHHLSKNEGIEGCPPYATIDEYRQVSGVTISYIVMWCYSDSFLRNDHFNMLYREISSQYHITYKSPSGRTMLFEKN